MVRRKAKTVRSIYPGGFSYLQPLGSNQFNDYDLLISKYAYKTSANFATLLARAFLQNAHKYRILDYDATRLAALGSRVAAEIELLTTFKLQDIFETALPSLLGDDASASLPLAEDTAMGIKKSLVGRTVFTNVSRFISGLYAQTVQVAGAVPGEGEDASYFLPSNKKNTAAALRTLKGTIASYDSGLQMAKELRVAFSVATEQDFKAPPPISLMSDLGAMLTYVSPYEEDNAGVETEYLHAFDETMDIIFHQMFGTSVFYDFMALFTTSGNSRAAGMVECLDPADHANDEASILTLNREATTAAALATNDTLASVLYNGAVASGLAWVLEGSFAQTVSNILSGESDWDQKLEDVIARFCDKPLSQWPTPYGLGVMPRTATLTQEIYRHLDLARYTKGASGRVRVTTLANSSQGAGGDSDVDRSGAIDLDGSADYTYLNEQVEELSGGHGFGGT